MPSQSFQNESARAWPPQNHVPPTGSFDKQWRSPATSPPPPAGHRTARLVGPGERHCPGLAPWHRGWGEEAEAPHKEVPQSLTAPLQLFPQVSQRFLATLLAPPSGRLGPHPWDLTPVHCGDPHGAPPRESGRGGAAVVCDRPAQVARLTCQLMGRRDGSVMSDSVPR